MGRQWDEDDDERPGCLWPFWSRLVNWLLGPEDDAPHYDNWDGAYWG